MKYISRPKHIDIDIANILGQKYRYRIDIGKNSYTVYGTRSVEW